MVLIENNEDINRLIYLFNVKRVAFNKLKNKDILLHIQIEHIREHVIPEWLENNALLGIDLYKEDEESLCNSILDTINLINLELESNK